MKDYKNNLSLEYVYYTMVFGFINNLFKKKERQPNRFGTRYGAMIAGQSYKRNADKNMDDLELIGENEYNKAYKNKKTGNIEVGVRGTNSAVDVLTDAYKLFGGDIKNTDRYKNTKSFVENIKKQNPTSNVNLYSHSLGGAISNTLAKDRPDLVSGGESYNPYLLKEGEASEKIKNYRTPTDVVSVLGVADKNVKTVGDASDWARGILDTHSLENFYKTGGIVRVRKSI
jgi:hypothetical protein